MGIRVMCDRFFREYGNIRYDSTMMMSPTTKLKNKNKTKIDLDIALDLTMRAKEWSGVLYHPYSSLSLWRSSCKLRSGALGLPARLQRVVYLLLVLVM